MKFPNINLFFRRMQRLKGNIPDYYSYDIPENVRHKIIGTILDFNYERERSYGGSYYNEMDEFVILIERELGRTISKELLNDKKMQDLMFSCSLEDFLSVLELLLSIKFENCLNFDIYPPFSLRSNLNKFIQIINEIFNVHKIGYEVVPVALNDLPFIVVPFNSKFLHLETIHKPRQLMYDEEFKGALDEFERALDSYRKENYDDCIVKSNKSFESTLKTILNKKNKSFDEAKDKIPQLINKIKDIDVIDSRFKGIFTAFWPCLNQGATNIRNAPSVAHGQGDEVKKIQKSYADFVLRNIGTNICFLIEQFRGMK